MFQVSVQYLLDVDAIRSSHMENVFARLLLFPRLGVYADVRSTSYLRYRKNRNTVLMLNLHIFF